MASLVLHEGPLCVYALRAADATRTERLLDVFTTLMPTYAHYAPRLRASIAQPVLPNGDRHFVWLVEIDGQAVGLTVFEYIAAENIGLGMDLALYPDYRDDVFMGYKLPHLLIRQRLQQLATCGQLYGPSPDVPLAVEVDSPRLLAQFQRYGLHVLKIPYYEPPDVSGETDIQGLTYDLNRIPREIQELTAQGYRAMHLGFYPPRQPSADFDAHDRALHERVLRAFYLHHYKLAPNGRAYLLAQRALQRLQDQTS